MWDDSIRKLYLISHLHIHFGKSACDSLMYWRLTFEADFSEASCTFILFSCLTPQSKMFKLNCGIVMSNHSCGAQICYHWLHLDRKLLFIAVCIRSHTHIELPDGHLRVLVRLLMTIQILAC